jgi:hypothetical protein
MNTSTKAQKELEKIKLELVKYKEIFEFNAVENQQELLLIKKMLLKLHTAEKKIRTNKLLFSYQKNPTVTFQLLGYDVVRYIYLKDTSNKIIESIELKRGDINTGAFVLGFNTPIGIYTIEIIGTHYPIVRGKVWKEGAKKLFYSQEVYKEDSIEPIGILIDFNQVFAESPWYPEKQDNPDGKELSIFLTPNFGIKEIHLMRSNSSTPVETWVIASKEFKGLIDVFLSDNDEYKGKYPDDIYSFECIGYHDGEKFLSKNIEKIDPLQLLLNWETKAIPISVDLSIDFDPRWLYFIPQNGEEEAIEIPGEQPYVNDVFYRTSESITNRLALGSYKIKVTGVGENQENKVLVSKKSYPKNNLYSKFEVTIKITDNNLGDERDMNQITNHLIRLGDIWWRQAVVLIQEKLKVQFQNTPNDLKGLASLIDDSIIGKLAEEFGSTPLAIANACEQTILFVIKKISAYATQELSKGKPTIDEILEKTGNMVQLAQSRYTITGIDANSSFKDDYLYLHRGLTTKKMLLQIEKDIDIIVVGKSMSTFVNDLFSKPK